MSIMGPVPVKDFMEKFMPYKDEKRTCSIDPSLLPKVFSSDSNAEHLFYKAVEKSGLCTGSLKPADTHHCRFPDEYMDELRGPDFTLFSKEPLLGDKEDSYDWAKVEMFGDIKREANDDPFADLAKNRPKSKRSEFPPEKNWLSRGQFVNYARSMFNHTHRTFCFSFVVMESTARLMFLDRGGIIYTEAFNWRDDKEDYLSEFLWRYCRMDKMARGWDTSVDIIGPNDDDAILARKLIRDNSAALPHTMAAESILSEGVALYRMKVWDEEAKEVHRVIVHKPQTVSPTFLSRATRGYVGVDLDEKKKVPVVWLKDTWRIDADRIPKEGDTYTRLHKRGVKIGLPDFRYAGDVLVNFGAEGSPPSTEVQATRTHAYAVANQDLYWHNIRKEDPGSASTMHITRHVHYRLILGKIGRPLNTFNHLKQLFVAIHGALLCHRDAVEMGEVLHRDISGGNVLMDKDGAGMLIDWDLCVYMDDKDRGIARRRERTGTWRFMSIRLLQKEPCLHDVRDDIESFVYLTWYYVLRYFPMSTDKGDLANTLSSTFDQTIRTDRGEKGGRQKKSLLVGALFDEETTTLCGAARAAMDYSCDLFSPLYKPARKGYPTDMKLLPVPGLYTTEQWQQMQQKAAAGVETHDFLIGVFDICIGCDPQLWNGADRTAHDVYEAVEHSTNLVGDQSADPQRRISAASHRINISGRAAGRTARPSMTSSSLVTPNPSSGTSNTSAGKRKMDEEPEEVPSPSEPPQTPKRSRRNTGTAQPRPPPTGTSTLPRRARSKTTLSARGGANGSATGTRRQKKQSTSRTTSARRPASAEAGSSRRPRTTQKRDDP